MRRIKVVDSHTGGEPTRVVVDGLPDLGKGSLAERRERFGREFDRFRSACVNEPRASEVIVGALLVEPAEPGCAAGVIYFNNVGTIGMCGHGTIGLMITLAHLGRIKPGEHRIDTPVGVVSASLSADGQVTVTNVASWREKKDVTVEVPGLGRIAGDIAWGGNRFFLVEKHSEKLTLENVEHLTDVSWRIRQALNSQGYPDVDHVELFSPGSNGARSRNFVLCPGKAYDRSPCGTGTSAKLACLAADGKLAPGQVWRQESIIGSVFEGSVRIDGDAIIPRIRGTAYINADSTLILDPNDPFALGIR